MSFMSGTMAELPSVRSMDLADAICQAATTQTAAKSSKSGRICRKTLSFPDFRFSRMKKLKSVLKSFCKKIRGTGKRK
jgi:hypothetical protein